MKRNEKYDTLPAWAYYDEVAAGSSEAVYYLLKRRLSKALRAVYELHGFGMCDDYEDTIDDYYLYLYEGNQIFDQQPFEMICAVQNKRAFFGWMVSTYRHFLLNKAKEEAKRRALLECIRSRSGEESGGLSNETMILILATAIAFADQQFTQRNRLILYRMLLSFLDHRKAIPQEVVAKALDMHPVTYRVSTKRQKDRFLEFILAQEAGTNLDLDSAHTTMRDRIVNGFEQLYEVLMEYYEATLNSLPNAKALQSLRLNYAQDDGMMHEVMIYGFGNNLDINVFYPNLKDYLTVSG